MTATMISRHDAEPSVEVVIETSRRMPVPTYSAILSQVSWSLDEIDRSARPGKSKRIEWGIVEVGGSATIRALLAPVSLPASMEEGTVSQMSGGLVNGVTELGALPEIPKLFSASTVRRVARVGAAVATGHVDEVRITSLNGSRRESTVTATTSRNAHEAVHGAQRSFGSVQGTLDVLDSRSKKGVRAQIYIPSLRRAVMVYAGPQYAAHLKEYWGRDVVASGELRRNNRGQAIRLDLSNIAEVAEPEHVSPWSLLGANRKLTGGSSTEEYMEIIRGR